MECIEKRVDMRISDLESSKEAMRVHQLLFKINHTLPFTDEYNELLKELFGKNLGKDSFVLAPVSEFCLPKYENRKICIVLLMKKVQRINIIRRRMNSQ